MNKRQRNAQLKYELGQLEGLDRPMGISRDILASIAMLEIRGECRTFQETYDLVEGLGGNIRKANSKNLKKDEVHIDRLGMVEGSNNPGVKCNSKHHKISILPSGEMILHAHEIDGDDEKATKVLSALSRMGGGTGNRTRINKAEHRCAQVKRLYNKAMSHDLGTEGLFQSQAKLPYWIQEIVVARKGIAKMNRQWNRARSLEHTRTSSISRDGFNIDSIGERFRLVLKASHELWNSRTCSHACNMYPTSTMGNRPWLSLYYRTRLLWAQNDNGGYNSIIIAADPTSRKDLGWHGTNPSEKAITEWGKFSAIYGHNIQSGWKELFHMAYADNGSEPQVTRVLAWNHQQGYFFANCKPGQCAVLYNWKGDRYRVSGKVKENQMESLMGPLNETTPRYGWCLTDCSYLSN